MVGNGSAIRDSHLFSLQSLLLPSAESWSSDGPRPNRAGQLAFEPVEKRLIAQRSADVGGGPQVRYGFVVGVAKGLRPPTRLPFLSPRRQIQQSTRIDLSDVCGRAGPGVSLGKPR